MSPGPRRAFSLLVGVVVLLGLGITVADGAPVTRKLSGPDSPVTVAVRDAPGGAAINENLIGVNHVVAGSAPALEAIHTQWARTDVSFEITTGSGPAYDCATGAWNSDYLDSQVALDHEAGATPELIVDYTPPCLATDPPNGVNPNYTPPDIGPDQAKWQALVYQMALHEITAEGVRIFEVWNEPNLGFWTGGLSGYLTLYRDTAQSLEEAATAAGVTIEVGGPALAEFAGLDPGWIRALAAYAMANDLPLDFVSWHVYADNPAAGPSDTSPAGRCAGTPPPGLPCWYNPRLNVAAFRYQIEKVKKTLAAFPALHPALWIDEWNIDSGADARIDGPYGAAFVAAVLGNAQRAGIDRMSFFDTADNATDATQNWGLLFADLSPKPAYDAMEMWDELAGSQLPVALAPSQGGTDSEGRIGAVASVTTNGTVKVLVWDFAPYDSTGAYGTSDPTPFDHPVTIKVTGLARRSYDVSRTLIDASHEGTSAGDTTVEGRSARLRFTLAGEGVTLLTLVPAISLGGFDRSP